MKNCVFCADLHGNISQYNKLKKFIKQNNIPILLLGGDLFPKNGGIWFPENKIRTIANQRKFIMDFFLPFLTELGSHCKTYFIFGNDDFASNLDLFKTTPSNSFLINQKLLHITDDLYIYGYPYVVLTPFLQKDWEKWDDGSDISQKSYTSTGYNSKNGHHIAIDFNKKKYLKKTIAADLVQVAKQVDISHTILLMHEPPYHTKLDQISVSNTHKNVSNEVHIGSKAISAFIKQNQPYLTLHGHIHETVEQSGGFFHKINNSLAITSGNNYQLSTLNVAAFDLNNLKDIKLIKIY